MGLLSSALAVINPATLASNALAGGEKLYDNYASAKAATKAFDREKWMMENRYQLQVSDLKKAGLNPALAYGQQAPMPAVPVAQTSKGGFGQSVAALASARQSSEMVKQIQAQTNAANAEAEYKLALAETERNRPSAVVADTQKSTASAQESVQRVQNLKVEMDRLREEILEVRARTRESTERADTLERMRELEARLKGIEAKTKEAMFPEAELRGKASAKASRGWDTTDKAAGETGHWIGNTLSDLRDFWKDTVSEWEYRRRQNARKKFGEKWYQEQQKKGWK